MSGYDFGRVMAEDGATSLILGSFEEGLILRKKKSTGRKKKRKKGGNRCRSIF